MTADWSVAATRGFSVFPLLPHSKRPAIEKWEPYQSAPPSPSLVAGWAAQTSLNMAVATGAVSGCIVLDADSLLSRIAAEERGLPDTLTVATPRGTHFYFNHPGWTVSNRAGRSWCGIDGLDLRADGGYVVGPGSYYVPSAAEIAAGKVEGAYLVERDVPVADAPEWLLALTMRTEPAAPAVSPRVADETTAYGRAALNDEITKLVDCPPGEVNNQINLTAFAIAQLVAGGEIVEDEGWGAITEALAARGLDGEDKANGTALRGWAAGLLVPRGVEHAEPLDPDTALGTRPMVALVDVPPPPAPAFKPGVKPLYVGGNEFADYFPGVVYVARRNEMFLPSGVMVKAASFDGIYGGPNFQLDADGSKSTRSAFEVFLRNSMVDMPKVWDICFRPELPPGLIITLEGLPMVNTYVPVVTPRRAGDASPFVDHIRKMLPDGRDAELLLHWMASAIQNPGKKFFWWPVIQGVKGNGKSLLLKVMSQAIGERYTHYVRADSVIKSGNQFNDWVAGKLFLGFEEIRSSEGKRDFVEMMKDTVTNTRLATEGKGVGQSTSDNRANGMMLTNWHDACPIDDDERRWGIFYCAQQKAEDLARDGMAGDYFPKLYEWIDGEGQAIITHYLANMPLRAELDPARGLHRSPETTSTAAAISGSLGMIEQELQEAIETGAYGFRGGVATSTGLRAVLAALRKRLGPNKYAGVMQSIGYVRHPALEVNRWRPNNALRDGSVPVLYFAQDHPILQITDAAEIKLATEAALFGDGATPSNVVPFRR